MSGIFGCWELAGNPLDDAVIRRCAARIGLQPHGAPSHRAGPSVAFASASSHPRVPPAGPLPSSAAAASTCVFDGRLDNREELLRTLSDAAAVGSTCEDGDLVVAAYERFGEAFAEHLDGDFALGLFDRRLNRLLLARDRLGVRPLCYTRIEGTFLFASDAKAMLTYPGVRNAPDDAMLADFILSFIASDAESRTFFAGIRSLPAAHLLIVTPEALTVRRYFDFDTGRRLRLTARADYVDGFHQRFVAAVRRRLRSASPVAIAVSGGLDSAYIYGVAQGLVRGPQAPCPAVRGFNYAGAPGTPSDESGFVDALEQACGTEIERIPEQTGFMDGAGESVWRTESPLVDGLSRQGREALRRMRAAGAGRLLTGHWGDQFLFDSDYLMDLLQSGRWRLLKRHAAGWGLSAPRLAVRLSRDAAARYLPPSFKRAIRRAHAGDDGCVWLAPWFTRRFRDILRERAAGARLTSPRGTRHAAAIYRQSRMEYHVRCMEWNHRVAATHDLEIAFPYLDCDLIQFLMSIPGDVQALDGRPRGLMREAMRGVVPAAVLERRSKGEFTHLTNAGIEEDFTAISDLLGPTALTVQSGYLDGPALRAALGRWRADIRTTGTAILANRLLDLCGFELLFRRFFSAGQDTTGRPLAAARR